MKDKVGKILKVGSKVAYGQRDGNTATTRVGTVTGFGTHHGETILDIKSEFGRKAYRRPYEVVVYG